MRDKALLYRLHLLYFIKEKNHQKNYSSTGEIVCLIAIGLPPSSSFTAFAGFQQRVNRSTNTKQYTGQFIFLNTFLRIGVCVHNP
ncbi:hypothetical protein SCO11_14230 [Legionella pneumophila serogroup 1]|uniref:hypothetical protein n=1 Tax=Legionella pneumophila TaxID=446 RepID=UPI000AE47C8E|nr:hypothetical protein [Legionella pneumophila]MCZ4679458.1 hypothetical protein [Legionella pneumophila]MCZ4751342.1 hypothetical protein [Legionella pneumophila]HAT1989542.1 hypothetical protein [Legionella pneumophila]HAT1992422.1 hypothetical protein [Legionella pneumophila]HAT2050168.1 hypothetical protein [Legionella pneumophila]